MKNKNYTKKTILTSLFIVILIAQSSVLLAQNNAKSIWKMVDNMIYREAEIDFKQVPSLAIAIIVEDSTYFKGFGSLKMAEPSRKKTPKKAVLSALDSLNLPNDSTVYEIGAFTKVFTATILAQAVETGKIRLDDTVQKFLPKGYILPDFNGKPIRFIDLATHTAGLPKYPYNIGQAETEDNNLFKNYTNEDEKEFLANYRLRNTPGTVYNYSHLGYDILAQALVHIYGTPDYATLFQQQITAPLALKQTGILYPNEGLAQGYSRGGQPVAPWTMASFQGSMGARSTVHDLLQFMRLQMDTPPEWQNVVSRTQQAQHPADKKFVDVALAWHRVTVLKKHPPVIVHTGVTDGQRMYFAFVPETRTGVVICANSEVQMNALGPLILQMLNYNWKLKPKKK